MNKNQTSWQTVKLSEVVKDFIVPMRDKPKEFSGNIPWCRIEDFDGIYLSKSLSDRKVSEKTVKEMNLKVYPVDTVLVSCSADLGRCAITSSPLVTNQTFIGLVLSPNLHSLFLYYLMSHSSNKLNNLSSGTTISYLSRRQFENFQVNIPFRIELQKRIAEIFFSIDEQINNTNQIIQKSEVLKQGLMRELLTKGIGHKKFKKTKLGEIPEEWSIEPLSGLTSVITKGTTPTTYGYPFTDEGVNFIKIENIDERGNIDLSDCAHISSKTNDILSRSKLREGDLLFSIAGAIGRSAVVMKKHLPANTNQALAIVRLNNNISIDFISQIIRSKFIQYQVAESSVQLAQANVSLEVLRNVLVPLPANDEQILISKMLFSVDKKIEQEEENKKRLLNLKSGLMQDIFSQKVEIN